jgi:hypothetical protein
LAAKFKPEIVTNDPLLVGLLYVMAELSTGASNEKRFWTVPTKVPTVRRTSLLEPNPPVPAKHVTVVAVLHPVVRHMSSCTIAVAETP